MVRVYKRRPGSRNYQNYSEETLLRCLTDIQNGRMTLNHAHKEYNIPKSTLSRKMRGIFSGPVGRPCVFKPDDEKLLAESIITASEWGFPLSCYEIRVIVKQFLDRNGIQEPRFRNNIPGTDWVRGFLTRHKQTLTERLCQNIKRVRAEVNADTINVFFNELENNLRGVDPAAIVNYDETNVTDDPGRSKVITRRGCKHPDRIMDSSKTSISVMFSGSASGTLLPPYICYKAEHMYDSWTCGGMKGTRYNRSKTGWFNEEIFEDWFLTIALPYFKKLPEDTSKVLLGDNLSSHVSIKVIRECTKNNIKFVLLPPNSTNLCQPLDVAFFRPLKRTWREVLLTWKAKNRGCVPKDRFPSLLKNVIDRLTEHNGISNNLKAGFKACGIFPIDREQVLKRLPKPTAVCQQTQQEENWRSTFETFLKETRESETRQKVKKKKLSVPPGKSVSVEDVEQKENIDPKPSSSGIQQKRIYRKRKITKEVIEEEDGDEDEICDISIHDSSSDYCEDTLVEENEKDLEMFQEETAHEEVSPEDQSFQEHLKAGDFVLVAITYDLNTKKQHEKPFVAQIINNNFPSFSLKFMRQSSKAQSFYFPTVSDIASVRAEQIKRLLLPKFNRRGNYQFDL